MPIRGIVVEVDLSNRQVRGSQETCGSRNNLVMNVKLFCRRRWWSFNAGGLVPPRTLRTRFAANGR